VLTYSQQLQLMESELITIMIIIIIIISLTACHEWMKNDRHKEFSIQTLRGEMYVEDQDDNRRCGFLGEETGTMKDEDVRLLNNFIDTLWTTRHIFYITVHIQNNIK
jgi:hypothetical protein